MDNKPYGTQLFILVTLVKGISKRLLAKYTGEFDRVHKHRVLRIADARMTLSPPSIRDQRVYSKIRYISIKVPSIISSIFFQKPIMLRYSTNNSVVTM